MIREVPPQYRCTAWLAVPSHDHVHVCSQQKYHTNDCLCACGTSWGTAVPVNGYVTVDQALRAGVTA